MKKKKFVHVLTRRRGNIVYIAVIIEGIFLVRYLIIFYFMATQTNFPINKPRLHLKIGKALFTFKASLFVDLYNYMHKTLPIVNL